MQNRQEGVALGNLFSALFEAEHCFRTMDNEERFTPSLTGLRKSTTSPAKTLHP